VVVEEPLEIRLGDRALSVTMRTPGHDTELALGFLVTEGIVRNLDAVVAVAACPGNPNVVEVQTDPGAEGIELPGERHFYATSSCGMCGKGSLEAIRIWAPSLQDVGASVERSVLHCLPERLREAQDLFSETGTLHGAGLFDLHGRLLCAREDVGRHNAVDKVVGWAAARGLLPLHTSLLLVSGRVGFEIVQKAVVAGIPILAAISGPSSLAVELARDAGQTLVAFLRHPGMNVYSREERIRQE
jgi:FdhD protein